MLDFAIFAVTFVVVLLIAVIYLYPGSSKPTTIPGLDPTTKEDGNLADIARAGSMHEFLIDLHEQFGDIASFWMGQRFVVSIAAPELFTEHQNVFDRPADLFEIFEPLIGSKSIQYANGSDGRSRRHVYDQAFTENSVKQHFKHYQKIVDDLQKKFTAMVKEEHVPLSQYMFAFALKASLLTLFGETFQDDKEILSFKRNYDVCWSEMERRLTEGQETSSPNEKGFQDALKELQDMVKKVVQHRKKTGKTGSPDLLVDLILGKSHDQEQVVSDAISYAVGSIHTSGNVLTWLFYFLATHPEVEEKLTKEIKDILGNKNVDQENIKKLKYLKQVIDETLRCAVVAPWAARIQDFDSELGGHKIPKNTPVIHALGVVLQNEQYWPLPNKFDPDRFSQENSLERPSMAFKPFGFAGKRTCPGQVSAYAMVSVCIVTLLKAFKLNLVEGQVVNPVHGLVTHPEEEIWVTISKR